jgi:acetyltransferase-like isoleucine patch superfamily enzyme
MLFIFRLRNNLWARLFALAFSRRFRRYGRRTRLVLPLGIEGIGNIALGDDVYIGYRSTLAAVPHTGVAECRLEIGSGTNLGSFNHVYATRSVVIGAGVLTANGVYISDNLHGYEDVTRPVKLQPIRQLRDTSIGDGTWVGHNACVYGARIGRNCVVGANAVVTRDVPDYCVVAGAPARIIKRHDSASGQWRRTDAEGQFLEATPPPQDG